MFTVIAIKMLQNAGYNVMPAGDIPGLWNVEGIARDVTTGQLHDIAKQHGVPWAPLMSSAQIKIGDVS